MTTNLQTKVMGRMVLRSAGELVAVAVFIFVTGWVGVRVAEAVHQHPVGPRRDGSIELRIAKSNHRGNVKFEEGQEYVGWWHCTGEWAIDWRFAPKQAGAYHVEVLVASPVPKPDDRIRITINHQVMDGAIPDTSGHSQWGRSDWKTINLGQISLESRPYSLTVQPAAAGGLADFIVKSVTLRPVQSSQ